MENLENKSEEVLNPTPEKEEKKAEETVKKEKKSKFWTKLRQILKKHPLVYILLLLLIIVLAWAAIKINIDKKKYTAEKSQIIERYEVRIDSLLLKNIQFSSLVFSWSIRSEMIRSNEENLSQLVTVFIKESNANLVQIVDVENYSILISSDKKYEGEKFIVPMKSDFKEQKTISTNKKTTVYTPIMGFNNIIGLLVVENLKAEKD